MRQRLLSLLAASTTGLKLVASPNDYEERRFDQHVLNSSEEYRKQVTEILARFKEKHGCPGIVAAISCSGEVLYNDGIGYADVERLVPARPNTVFRIASISKAITSLLVGRYMEQGKLSLDEDVRFYFESFPVKKFNGLNAKLTPRSLMNHTSGIRSYTKSEQKDTWPPYPEMLIQTRYDSAVDACKLFEQDALEHAPGQKFLYSTFAFTLLSAVLETACARSGPAFDGAPVRRQNNEKKDAAAATENSLIPKHCQIGTQLSCLFGRLGLRNTRLDYSDQITPFRASQYRRESNGTLLNTPTVDNSYKWAGGGILSTANDLLLLANHLALIYTTTFGLSTPGIVRHDTLKQLWTVSASNPESVSQPGLGWFIARRSGNPPKPGSICPDRLYVGHTGGALGGTTMLLLSLPCCSNKHPVKHGDKASALPPICVVVLTNLEDVRGISELTVSLAEVTTDYCTGESRPSEVYSSLAAGFNAQPLTS